MSRINRVPFGLQDLLGSQNLGVNPSDMAQQVAPTLDLFPFWSAERLTMYTDTAVEVTARGAYLAYTVPLGEAWIPLWWSGALPGFEAAGQEIRFTLNMLTFPNIALSASNVSVATTGVFVATAVGEVLRLPYSFPQRTMHLSGTQFRLLVDHYDANGAANVFIQHTLCYVRLET